MRVVRVQFLHFLLAAVAQAVALWARAPVQAADIPTVQGTSAQLACDSTTAAEEMAVLHLLVTRNEVVSLQMAHVTWCSSRTMALA